MTQQPCPDRFVRAKSFTAKSHLAVRTNRPRLFLNSLDRTLSGIGCRTVLRCRLELHQISRHVFHFVCQSHRCRLSVTPQPYVLVKETLIEFDQSSGRIVSGLLASTATRVVAYFFSVSPLPDVVFTNAKSNAITGLFSLLAQVTTEMWVIFPTSHDT